MSDTHSFANNLKEVKMLHCVFGRPALSMHEIKIKEGVRVRAKTRLTENITRLCAEKKISVMYVEMKCRLGNGTISRWSEHPPSVDRAKRVAEFFGITLDELMQ